MKKPIPTASQYKEVLEKISDDLRLTVMFRLMSETGMAREELVNLKRSDLDRYHKKGIWIEKAKRIKKGNRGNWEMRSREVPINTNLYTLLQAYLSTHGSPYIIHSKRMKDTPTLKPSTVNKMFKRAKIEFRPHGCRHYFKAQVRMWMIRERCIDIQVIKEIMGHTLTVAESYGGESDFSYKLDIVNSVFD